MQASNEQKQERTEKMIVLKKSPKWWATVAATGGLIVGMTSGFGLGMLATANTTPQRQQATVSTQNTNQPNQNPQGQNGHSNSQGFNGQNGGPGQGEMNGQLPQDGGLQGQEDKQQNGKSNKKSSKKSSSKKSSSNTKDSSKDETGTAG